MTFDFSFIAAERIDYKYPETRALIEINMIPRDKLHTYACPSPSHGLGDDPLS